MKWYNDMSEQEKRSFQKVIAVCVVGAILILIVPIVFHTISYCSNKSKFPAPSISRGKFERTQEQKRAGQKYALNRNRTGLRMAFRSKIDLVTGLPPHRHSLKLPGKWKRAVPDPQKWKFPLNILGETSWRNPRSRPYCVQSHHLYLNRRQYRLAYSNPRGHCDNSKFLKQNPKHYAET